MILLENKNPTAICGHSNFLNYPSSITILNDSILQFCPKQLMTPSGVGIIQCHDHIKHQSEALLTYFLFSIMKLCELKSNVQTADTIGALFDGDFDKYFLFMHWGFKYGVGCIDVQKIKAPDGKVIYKRVSGTG